MFDGRSATHRVQQFVFSILNRFSKSIVRRLRFFLRRNKLTALWWHFLWEKVGELVSSAVLQCIFLQPASMHLKCWHHTEKTLRNMLLVIFKANNCLFSSHWISRMCSVAAGTREWKKAKRKFEIPSHESKWCLRKKFGLFILAASVWHPNKYQVSLDLMQRFSWKGVVRDYSSVVEEI